MINNASNTSHLKRSPFRAAAASLAGAVLDWYEFFVYGLVAVLVFPTLFFPSSDPSTSILLTFATFGIGFIARPVGGIVFGHYGDRIGRKAMLVLTLFLMGISTAAIGLLPTYEQIGIAAPIILVSLRFVQGFAVGGEWGGATLMAVEHAPQTKRGFFGSFVQVGASVGLLVATGVVALVNQFTTPEEFLSYGWRIPFLLSLFVVFGGYLIRRGVSETPEFLERIKEAKTKSKQPIPLVQALKNNPGAFLKIIGMRFAELVGFYIVTVFALNYGSQHGIPRASLLGATMVVGMVAIFLIPLAGAISDRIGRRPVYLFGTAMGIIGAFPLFWAIDSQNIVLITLAFILIANLSHDPIVAVQQPLFSEMFDPAFRYSGAGLAYQLASAIAGGITPLLAAFLVVLNDGGYNYVALYLAGACALSMLIGALFAGKPTEGNLSRPTETPTQAHI